MTLIYLPLYVHYQSNMISFSNSDFFPLADEVVLLRNYIFILLALSHINGLERDIHSFNIFARILKEYDLKIMTECH